jgi:hypothetical protein
MMTEKPSLNIYILNLSLRIRKRVENAVTSKGIQVGIECK